MDYLNIIKDIKAKKTSPIYILYGKEAFYIDEIIHEFEHNFTESAHVGFDQTIVYGKETNFIAILNTVNRYPLLAQKNVVIVKEAQEIADIEALTHYSNHPNSNAILVMGFKYINEEKKKQEKVFSQLKNNTILFKSEPIKDYNTSKWLSTYCAEHKIPIELDAIQLLSDYIGPNLTFLINEIKKIRVNLEPNQPISAALIEKGVGISKVYSVYEFQDALGDRNSKKALSIANYYRFNDKEHHILRYLSPLFGYYQKLLLVKQFNRTKTGNLNQMLETNDYFAKKYIASANKYTEKQLIIILKLIYQYDLKAKGVENAQVESGDLLVELTTKILLA